MMHSCNTLSIKSFFFLLILSLGIVFPTVSKSATFNVPTDMSLQDALNTAESNGEADTINIASGTYNISSTIEAEITDNHPITIKAEDPNNKPILDGGGTTQIMDIRTSGTDANADITIEGIVFRNGVADNDGFGNSAGGSLYLLADDADITLKNCEFINNEANDYGGGAFLSTGANTEVTKCVFKGNSATTYGGGGIYAGSLGGSFTFTNNVVYDNEAGNWGGGVELYLYGGGTINVINNSFSKNEADSGGGIDIFLDGETSDNSTVNLYNNIVWDNTATGSGDDIYVFAVADIDSTLNLFNNLLGTNSDFDTASSEDFGTENIDTYNQGGNIKTDPLFEDPSNGDLHLQHNSPAIDAGNETPPGGLSTTDIEGNPRSVDGNEDGSTVDMGAYEYQDACSDGEDNDGDGDTDCADSDCSFSSSCGTEVCDDSVDNDGDGNTDCADSDCDTSALCEASNIDCSDGVDNDGDGKIDCLDEGCDGLSICEFGTETTCDDGEDNDADGDSDCDDADCSTDPACEDDDGGSGCSIVPRTTTLANTMVNTLLPILSILVGVSILGRIRRKNCK